MTKLDVWKGHQRCQTKNILNFCLYRKTTCKRQRGQDEQNIFLISILPFSTLLTFSDNENKTTLTQGSLLLWHHLAQWKTEPTNHHTWKQPSSCVQCKCISCKSIGWHICKIISIYMDKHLQILCTSLQIKHIGFKGKRSISMISQNFLILLQASSEPSQV